MKYLAILGAAGLLLSGCATTIRSDVTAFNAWPADLPDKTYAFETPPSANDTLELRSYEALVGNEMSKLGFRQAADGQQPKLLVGMQYQTVDQALRVLETDYAGMGPYWGPGYGRFGGFYGYSRWSPYRSMFYDPFMFGPTVAEESIKHQYDRSLRVTINSVGGGKLFDVTVTNSSRVKATPAVIPLMVQSAFTGFPGQSGVARTVDLKLEPKDDAKVAGEPAAKAN